MLVVGLGWQWRTHYLGVEFGEACLAIVVEDEDGVDHLGGRFVLTLGMFLSDGEDETRTVLMDLHTNSTGSHLL